MQALWKEPFRPAASCLKSCHILFVSSWLLLPPFGGLLFPGGERRRTVGLCALSLILPSWYLHSRSAQPPPPFQSCCIHLVQPWHGQTLAGTSQQTWGPAGGAEPCVLMSVREPREIVGVCLFEGYMVLCVWNVVRETHKMWSVREISEYLKRGLFSKSIKYVSK